MSFLSYTFFIFVIISVAVYYICPIKYRWIVLLVSSFAYYFLLVGGRLVNLKYFCYMLVTIASTYFLTRWIESILSSMNKTLKAKKGEWDKETRTSYRKKREKKARIIMIFALLLNFGVLAFLKYAGPYFSLIVPVGISFYTFQSMGYVIDVYQEKVSAEKNIAKVALFVSFFPQIIQGPIAMYSDLAKQLYEGHRFDYEKIKRALLLILWGFFKKLVIADRAVLFINMVTENSNDYTGTYILFTVLLYAIQLYADFSGGIDIIRGVGELYGITMAENFKRPYFSKSLTEYWHRWHMTLGNWVRNYVFYPLSISKTFLKFGRWFNGKGLKHLGKVVPTCLASLITFLIIGIWHGANFKYVLFGLWNGLVIMLIELFKPVTEGVQRKLHVNTESRLHGGICMVWTFILVLVGYFFDIARDAADAFSMLWKSVSDIHIGDFSDFEIMLTNCGLDLYDFFAIVTATIILLIVSIVQEKKQLVIREWIMSRKTAKRWAIIYLCIFIVIIFGYYGPDISPADFVYMQF